MKGKTKECQKRGLEGVCKFASSRLEKFACTKGPDLLLGPVCSYVITPLTAETQSETDHRNHTVHRRSVDGGPKKPTDRDSSSDIDESGEDDADEDQDDQSDTTTALPSGHSPIPFHVEVTDKSTGKAVIRLSERANLGCQDKEYAFKIAPRKCGSTGEVGDRYFPDWP